MKIFSSEFGHNFDSYSFGYSNYALKEKNDKLHEIYERGYLPYSGSPDAKDIFYMARSARVPLKTFQLTSENRRILKKFDNAFSLNTHKHKDFDCNTEFISFCTEYFVKRHGPKIMPEERFRFILNSNLISHIVSYSHEKQSKAYVLEVRDETMTHFWYSFYDLSLIHQSLGMWLMLQSALRAQSEKKEYLYIGTVYGSKALYKTAFKNLEFWTGDSWSGDITKLKRLARSDVLRSTKFHDLWKEDISLF